MSYLETIPKEIQDYWYGLLENLNRDRQDYMYSEEMTYNMGEYKTAESIIITINFGNGFHPHNILCKIDRVSEEAIYLWNSKIYSESEMLRILKNKILW